MSADNGIYILRTPAPDGRGFEFRVAHAQAIEIATDTDEATADNYILATFGRSWVLHRKGRAKAVAHLLNDDFVSRRNDTEYGVQIVEVNRPFPYSGTRRRLF